MLAAERGAARNTLDAYRTDLEDFAGFCARRGLAEAAVGPEPLRDYLRSLADLGLKPRTAARRLSTLRQFFRFLARDGVRPDDPTELLEGPRPTPALPKPITEDEVTALLAGGAAVSAVADEIGWSARSMQRQCAAVYGYGPTTLRRVLRFRRAVALLRSGVSPAQAASRAGYADQPHLHREVRELAGLPLSELRQPSSGAYRSTTVPSGSVTLA